MGELAVMLVVAGFYLGLILVLAGIVLAVIGAAQRSSGTGRAAGWLFCLGAVLALVSGTVIWNALADIGS